MRSTTSTATRAACRAQIRGSCHERTSSNTLICDESVLQRFPCCRVGLVGLRPPVVVAVRCGTTGFVFVVGSRLRRCCVCLSRCLAMFFVFAARLRLARGRATFGVPWPAFRPALIRCSSHRAIDSLSRWYRDCLPHNGFLRQARPCRGETVAAGPSGGPPRKVPALARGPAQLPPRRLALAAVTSPSNPRSNSATTAGRVAEQPNTM